MTLYTRPHSEVSRNSESSEGTQAQGSPHLFPGARMWSLLFPLVPSLQGDMSHKELAGCGHRARKVSWVGKLGHRAEGTEKGKAPVVLNHLSAHIMGCHQHSSPFRRGRVLIPGPGSSWRVGGGVPSHLPCSVASWELTGKGFWVPILVCELVLECG